MRLDHYLLSKHPNITRPTIKKAIMNGVVSVNGNFDVRPNYKVQESDRVVLNESDLKKFLSTQDNSEIVPIPMDLSVIYEDKDIIVVDKKEGLTSHPVPGHREDTLLNGIVYYFLQNKIEGKPRLVNRLDKDTSGLILVAKNLDSQQYYSKQFEERKVTKIYEAVIDGDFQSYLKKSNKEFVHIVTYLTRSATNRKFVTNTSKEKGEQAITDVYFKEFWKPNPRFCVVRIIPKTGRTHQIRVHLQTLGFPILGDPLYSKLPYKRLMLNSQELQIKKPNEEVMNFKSKFRL